VDRYLLYIKRCLAGVLLLIFSDQVSKTPYGNFDPLCRDETDPNLQ
jgi:hypothetical protein